MHVFRQLNAENNYKLKEWFDLSKEAKLEYVNKSNGGNVDILRSLVMGFLTTAIIFTSAFFIAAAGVAISNSSPIIQLVAACVGVWLFCSLIYHFIMSNG